MPRIASEKLKQRLQDVRRAWLREERMLRAKHGERWHSILNTSRLERIEEKGRKLTRQLAVHPDWWTLPCECKACAEENHEVRDS